MLALMPRDVLICTVEKLGGFEVRAARGVCRVLRAELRGYELTAFQFQDVYDRARDQYDRICALAAEDYTRRVLRAMREWPLAEKLRRLIRGELGCTLTEMLWLEAAAAETLHLDSLCGTCARCCRIDNHDFLCEGLCEECA